MWHALVPELARFFGMIIIRSSGRQPIPVTPRDPNWSVRLVGMDIEEIGAFEAKTRLSQLLDQVRRGRVYRITKRGKPVAELRPPTSEGRRPRFGHDRGRIIVADDFDAPLPDLADYE